MSLIRLVGGGFVMVALSAAAGLAAERPSGAQPVRCPHGPRASVWASLDALPAGIAAGREVVFVGAPLDGQVRAFAREDGRPLGVLPPPPAGFVLPFIMHTLGPDRVVVLDAGGFPTPAPFVPAIPTLHEYRYRRGPQGLVATLERSIHFDGLPFGFAEDFTPLPRGGYAVTDAVFGAIWLVDDAGRVTPGLTPQRFDFTDGIPGLMMCPTMPTVQVGGVPFLFSGSAVPGAATLIAKGETLFVYSPCSGTLFSVPLASLRDQRAPWERAADLHVVSTKPAEVPVEELIGFSADLDDPRDPFIYAADALQLRLIRIDTRTGQRDVIGDDPTLFNFPSSTAYLGGGAHGPRLFVVSNQQHRLRLTNDALAEDLPALPFLVSEVPLPR